MRLNRRGQTYFEDVQRIFLDLSQATERQINSRGAQMLKLIVVEVVAAKWLLPRLVDFKLAYPEVGIELDTEQSGIDLRRRNFDVWITFAEQVPGGLPAETLFEESLVPVCSPALIEARGLPERPDELVDWPLLYDLEWSSLWSHWFASQGAAAPDLWRASGFRLYSMMVQAAVEGMGVALAPCVDDRRRARTGNSGRPVRCAGRGARPLSSGDHADFWRPTRGPGFPEVDPGAGFARFLIRGSEDKPPLGVSRPTGRPRPEWWRR